MPHPTAPTFPRKACHVQIAGAVPTNDRQTQQRCCAQPAPTAPNTPSASAPWLQTPPAYPHGCCESHCPVHASTDALQWHAAVHLHSSDVGTSIRGKIKCCSAYEILGVHVRPLLEQRFHALRVAVPRCEVECRAPAWRRHAQPRARNGAQPCRRVQMSPSRYRSITKISRNPSRNFR